MENRFWLGLVGLCAAAACGLAIMLALVSATTAIAFASHPDPGAAEESHDIASRQKVFTGMVTDSSCGARHMTTDKNAAECTRECMKKGASYALVNADRIYRLEGETAEIGKLAGQRALIKGLLEGDVVAVSSIAPAE
jgi:hypothetical protein